MLRWHLNNPGSENHPSAPDVPIAGRRVWSIFIALNNSRGSGGFGPSPIGYGEIESWSRLHREPLRSFEIDMIRTLDMAFIEAAAERINGPKKPEVSSRPFSLELFDALFAGN